MNGGSLTQEFLICEKVEGIAVSAEDCFGNYQLEAAESELDQEIETAMVEMGLGK
jgi:hypothetical protein